MEQITIFSRIQDPEGVAQKLRAIPGCLVSGDDGDWHSALIESGSGEDKLALAISHDPDYYSEPNWSVQMSGMRTYLSRFPESAGKERALLLPSTFTFSLGVVAEPDFVDDDPRLAILYEITEFLDGVIFTGVSLLDASGRVLFSRASEDEDSQASWPKVIASVQIDADEDTLYFGPESDIQIDPPLPQRVARRALALTALTARALMEEDADNPEAHETHKDLLQWIGDIGIADEFEEIELEVLETELGSLSQEAHINSTWRLEGLVVLAWALNLAEIPAHDELVMPNLLWRALGLLNADEALSILSDPNMRSRDDLLAMREKIFALHWRLVDFQINPSSMDFAHVASTCSFGPLDISSLRLINGDLALGTESISSAPNSEFYSARSAAQERHQAINWLCDGPSVYSMASVDT